MKRDEAIAIIRDYLSQRPIEWVGVFGSFARDEMSPDSDIDLAIHFKDGAKVTLFDYADYKLDLEELLGRKIDLISYDYLRPKIKSYIDRDLQIIYRAA